MGDKPKRRVLFKTPAHNKGKGTNRVSMQMALKNSLDNDVSMAEGSYSRGSRNPMNLTNARKGILNRKKPHNVITWYKVIIPFGHKYPKDFIINSIANLISPHTFVPIAYKILDKEANFYLDSEEEANIIETCHNKILAADGFKFKVFVRPGYPNIEAKDFDDSFKNKIISALDQRYIGEHNALDLSNFHRHPELVSEYFCALFRVQTMNIVLSIIAERFPQLMAINFNDNKLIDLRALRSLKDQFKNLKILYLGHNRIKDFSQLNVLKGLENQLEELFLQGNPCCSRYNSRENDYVCDIQKKFPKLCKLDGKELTKPITFDLEDDSKNLLPPQMVFAPNEESKNIVVRFLMEYFQTFDSMRQNLLNAYHEQAMFSMTVSYQSKNHELNNYFSENRNLLRVTDPFKKHKLLKTGKLHILSTIDALPRTIHIKESFTLDVCLTTNQMIMVVVTGIFKELDGKDEPLRYFHRTLIIVPEGNGFCICNEQLHITCTTDEQEKKWQSFIKPQSAVSTNTSVSTSTVTPSKDIMEQMAITLSQQSYMNIAWSTKCLQECSWNYDNALAAFQTCLNNGQIPPEAFSK